MRSRSRSIVQTLVLVAVAAGAVTFAWFGIFKKDAATSARKAAEEKLFTFDPAQVQSVVVEAQGDTTRIARVDGGWRVEAPVQAAAERATVDKLLEKVAGLRRNTSVLASADDKALAQFGLAQPRGRVTITLQGGATETLALGNDTTFEPSVFVRTTRGGVDVAGAEIKTAVLHSTYDFREKRLLPFEENELGRIAVVSPKLAYTLFRAPDAWKLEAPMKDTADENAIDRVLNVIRNLRATAFVKAPQPDRIYGLDHPRWRLTMTSPSGATRGVAIGVPPAPKAAKGAPPPEPEQLYARLDGSREVAVVAADAGRDLDADLFSLRDKRVMRFTREQVASARFTVDGKTFDGKNEVGSRIASLLWTFTTLQAKAFVDESGKSVTQHGLDHPSVHVALVSADGKELDHLDAVVRDGKAYARSGSLPRIVEIDPENLKQLPHSAEELKAAGAGAQLSDPRPQGR